ncbi:MAG: DUF4115 domain-containing protein [Ferrovum sp.]|nr:DUF4115 domain-containing protein [Ferrovum sp.]
MVSPEPPPSRKGKVLVGRPLLWAFAVLVIILVGLVFVVRESSHDRVVSPATPAPSPVAPVLPAIPVESVASPATPSQTDNALPPIVKPVASSSGPAKTGALELQLNFTAATWVSVYRRDGGHEQKVYGPEETLKLDVGPLAELIIGNAPAARLSVGNNEVNLKRFTNPDSNVARIMGQNLRDLGTAHP